MKTPSPKTKPVIAFSLVEMLVVTGIAAVLLALLVPAVSRSMDSGKRTRCAANLRQIGMGILNYASENNGQVPYIVDWGKPGQEFWYDAVCEGLNMPDDAWRQERGLFYCPAAKTKAPNYTMSWTMTDRRLASVTNSSQRVIVGEGDGNSGAGISDTPPFGGLEPKRHKTGANYLFVDGHIEYLTVVPTNGLAL